MALTIDELAVAAGTTSRSIRSFQTIGLLDHPDLRGRTGVYSEDHFERLRSILLLQSQGFSLQSLVLLFTAHARGESLGTVLGLPVAARQQTEAIDPDMAELYGFADLQSTGSVRRAGSLRRPFLSVVPTTVWDQTEAS